MANLQLSFYRYAVCVFGDVGWCVRFRGCAFVMMKPLYVFAMLMESVLCSCTFVIMCHFTNDSAYKSQFCLGMLIFSMINLIGNNV